MCVSVPATGVSDLAARRFRIRSTGPVQQEAEMLVTPHFVFVNNPRTGTTFARQAIKAAYSNSGRLELVDELLLPVQRGWTSSSVDHHGTVEQIPAAFSNLPIASAVRNPYTLAVSNYELGAWKSRAPIGHGFLKHFDRFPNLSLSEYLHLQDSLMRARWGISYEEHGIGPMSAHFIQMFARSSALAFDRVRGGAPFCEISKLIANVQFLRQETLRADLGALLAPLVGPEAASDAVALRPRHVTRRQRTWSSSTLGIEATDHVMSREAFLFCHLEMLGVKYTLENADFFQQKTYLI